jgi:peptide/nickel transport system permease protein
MSGVRVLLAGIARAALAVLLATTTIFFLLRVLPGDGIEAVLLSSGASAEQIAERQAALGLNRPVPEQFASFVRGLTRGELGVSLLSGVPVHETLLQALRYTIPLAGLGWLFSVVLGFALGALAAERGLSGRIAQELSVLFLSVPVYVTGTLVIVLLVGVLRIISLSDPTAPASLIAAASVLALPGGAALAGTLRTRLRAEHASESTRFAISRGLRPRTIWWQYRIRPSLPVFASAATLQAGLLLAGTTLVEIVFNRPGVGRVLLDATLRQDYPVVQGVALWLATVYAIAFALSDTSLALLDPRVRQQEQA